MPRYGPKHDCPTCQAQRRSERKEMRSEIEDWVFKREHQGEWLEPAEEPPTPT